MEKKNIKIWTDLENDDRVVKRYVDLPKGMKEAKCIKCGGSNLIGAIITETADEQDPNIVCLDCGFWRD